MKECFITCDECQKRIPDLDGDDVIEVYGSYFPGDPNGNQRYLKQGKKIVSSKRTTMEFCSGSCYSNFMNGGLGKWKI